VISSLPQLTTNQLVGLSVAEELERRGHYVDLYCIGRVTREQLIATFQKPLKSRIFSRRWLWDPGSTIYDNPILAALMGGYRGYDLVFEAIGPVVHISRSRTPGFTYVFFPPDPDLMGDREIRSFFWRIYSAPYRIFYKMFSDNVRSTRILSISQYIADLCKKAWGVESEVVYFPVPISQWKPTSNSTRDGVISIGRFSSEKNQLEQVNIAEALQSAGVSSPVRVIGAVASSLNHRLYLDLRKQAEKRRIANILFYPNLPRKRIISMAHSSKVFLHTMKNEHFGIATVEAIAAGCIPIVHDSGGTREIVPISALRFRTEHEATGKIMLALEGEFDRYLPQLRRHISMFSEESFKERLTKIILGDGEGKQEVTSRI